MNDMEDSGNEVAPGLASKPENDRKQYLTITLTDRPPVRVDKDDWPVIAASDDWDNQYEFQANNRWKMRVRRGKDGRTIVYAILDSCFRGSGYRGGELLEASDDVSAAIRRVGERAGFSARLIDECIADLPAEPL